MTGQANDLGALSVSDLGTLARRALDELAARDDQTAFAELLSMNAHIGQCLAAAARALAASGSWTQVADLSGTTKQAAWSRWHA
jgi:hypothetical protein